MAPPVDCEISIKLVNGITDSYRHSKQLFGVATLLYADLFYIVNWTLNWDVIGHVFDSTVYRARSDNCIPNDTDLFVRLKWQLEPV